MMRHLAPLVALAFTAACADQGATRVSGVPTAALRVVNGATAAGAVRVYVDQQPLDPAVAPGQASGAFTVGSGAHTVELRPVASGAAEGITRTLSFTAGNAVTVVALDSGGGVTPAVLADTGGGAIVPAGATKLRVAHMASHAPNVDIWRTQPDFATPIRIQFPFPYRAVSPYLQSTPGDWRVMVSHRIVQPTDPMPDTLANSGAISIPTGTSRTVVVVDAPGGGVATVVLDP